MANVKRHYRRLTWQTSSLHLRCVVPCCLVNDMTSSIMRLSIKTWNLTGILEKLCTCHVHIYYKSVENAGIDCFKNSLPSTIHDFATMHQYKLITKKWSFGQNAQVYLHPCFVNVHAQLDLKMKFLHVTRQHLVKHLWNGCLCTERSCPM